MQPVDFTTLSAAIHELRTLWLPARIEQVRQEDYQTIRLQLKTLRSQRWLLASCHPQAARVHFSEAKSGRADRSRFPFAATLYQYLAGRVLVRCLQPAWERIVRLGFARRPEEEPEVELVIEVMGKYSNIVLIAPDAQILGLAHSVSSAQSRVRPLVVGDSYQLPPPLTGPAPSRLESFEEWRSRLAVVGEAGLASVLVKSYRGVSQVLVQQMLERAGLPGKVAVAGLDEGGWQALWQSWQEWLERLETGRFEPGRLPGGGYTVLGWGKLTPERSLQAMLELYYSGALIQDQFRSRRQRLLQVLGAATAKADRRVTALSGMMAGGEQAEEHKQKADLLMAHLHMGVEPGTTRLELDDFDTGLPVSIQLDPAKDLVGNAQAYYRLHRKAKRAVQAVAPLLAQAREEADYLAQVGTSVELLTVEDDFDALVQVEEELVQQGYLEPRQKDSKDKSQDIEEVPFHRFGLGEGRTVLVGRNNRQNDRLTFEVASPADLWFHAQEIPGSHVLLKLPPGQKAESHEVQLAANVAAHFSRARQSGHVPVVYTERRHVRKLKGGRPGLVTFKEEKVIWGNSSELPPVDANGKQS